MSARMSIGISVCAVVLILSGWIRAGDAPEVAPVAASAAKSSVVTPIAPAQADFFTGKYKDALAKLAALPDADKAKPDAIVLQSRILRATGRDAEALKAVEAALSLSADQPDLLCEKAEILTFLGKYADAEALFAKAIEKKDDHLRARLLQALLWKELERADDVHEALGWFFDYYGEHDTFTPEEQTLIGCGGFWGGAPEDGFRIVREAIKADPTYYPARVALAQMYLDKGQLPDAERTITEIRERNPDDPEALALLAGLRAGQRRLDLTTKICEKALTINPRLREALMTLALLSWIDEDDAGALAKLDEVFAINPDWPPARRLQAGVFFCAGRMKEYADVAARIAGIQKSPAQLHSDTAGLLMMLNRLNDAVAEYRKAVEANPDHAEALAGLGMALMHLAKDDEAKAFLDRAFQIDGFDIRTFNERLLLKRDSEYATIQSKHWTIRVPKDDRDTLALFAGQDADRHIEEMAAHYGWTVPEGLTLMLTRTQADFAARVTGLPRMDANGVCFGENVLIVSPGDGTRAGRPFNWSDVLRHELTHTVTVTMSDYRIPRWLTEGASVAAQATIDRNWDIPFATTMNENMLPELATFNRWFNRPQFSWQVPAGYCMAGLFVRWFEKDYGPKAMETLFAAFAKSESAEKAFAEATGKTLAEIEQDFHAKLREYAKTVQAPPLIDPAKIHAIKAEANAKKNNLPAQGAWMPIAWHMGAADEAARAAEMIVTHEEDYRKVVPAARGDEDIALAHRIMTLKLLDTDVKQAHVHLDAAMKLMPERAGIHMAAGALAMKEEKWQDAVAAFEKAVSLYPRYAGPMNPYAGLVAAHDKLKEPLKAIDALERYCAVAIDDPDALADLAKRYKEQSKPAEEERTLAHLFRVDPFNADALARMAEISKAAGRTDEAAQFTAAATHYAKKKPEATPEKKQPKSEAEEFGVHEW